MFRRKNRSSRKRPAAASLAQLCVGCGDEANVDGAGLRGSNAFEFAGLQHTQKFCLLPDGNIGDFVEEKRAVVRKFKAPDAVCARVSKGAFHVSEEFAFECALRKRAGVDGDQGAVGAL